MDGAGNALVTGRTSSSGWASGGYGGGGDAFVAKISSGGAFTWATYVGGSSDDQGLGIAVDGAGNALVTGWTYSSGWASGGFGGGSDAFVAKISPGGELTWATYLGGSNYDWGRGIALDGAGNALVTGRTNSSGWATGGYGGGGDGFVAKLTSAGMGGGDHGVFEILARGVAYEDWDNWPDDDPIVFDGSPLPLPYTLDGVFQDNRGFYALGLLSDLYGPALVIRGTEPKTLVDWWANSDPRGVGYGQFVDNWESVSGWLSGLDVPADVVGHSLGGAIGQWIAAAFTSGGGLIDELVTFNSPGIGRSNANAFDPDNAGSVTHYIVNGDVFSMAGEAYVPGAVRMASFSDLNPINKHLLPLLVPNVGDREQPVDVSLVPYSVDALSSATYSHTDRDYRMWLAGFEVGLKSLAVLQPWVLPLVPVPAMLKERGTTEAGRQLVGKALRAIELGIEGVEALFEWTVDATGKFVLELGERAHDLYELLQITVDPDFSLTVDDGDPPMLRFDGGLSIGLGNAIDINLPSWLGGSFIADRLVKLVDMDYGGVIDRDQLLVYGQLALLGDLVTLDGMAELDWQQGRLTVFGALDILDGFITAGNSARIGANLDLVLRGDAAVSIPSGVPWIGGKQIAGAEFLLNYVNDLSRSNDFVAGWGTLAGIELGLRVRLDGTWDILGAKKIAALELPAPAPPEGPAPPETYTESYSIPPATDWVLFAAEWENASPTVALELTTPAGQLLTEADVQADPNMTILAELTDENRKFVRVDAPEAGVWQVAIVDTTGLGAVDVAAMVYDSVPAVSNVSVGDSVFREPTQIRVEAYDADSDAQVALFRDTDAEGFDGVMIVDGLAEPDGPIDYTWDTSGVVAGEYYVYARIIDESNPPVFAYADSPMRVTDPAWVTDRYLFYNGAAYDGNDGAADEQDDAAIATDKRALLPGETATAANFTNFEHGINGIMVDVATYGTISADDFAFRVGSVADPATWTDAPGPAEVSIRAEPGEEGSLRVTVTWDDGAITNQWLEVTVVAGPANGLVEDDVFYFGNAVGETGNEPTNALVNAADVVAIRDNPRGELNPAGIDNPFDINRDMRVDALDLILARNNATSPLSALRLITPSTASPAPRFAADAEGRMFPPASEGESMFATRSLASEGTSFLESLDGLMAVQVARPAVDSLLPSPTLGKLLRRFGPAIK